MKDKILKFGKTERKTYREKDAQNEGQIRWNTQKETLRNIKRKRYRQKEKL